MLDLMSFVVLTGETEAIIALICTLIGAIGGLIPVIIKLVAALKEIAKNKNWLKIVGAIKEAIIKAEATGKSGAEKKQIVIDAVIAFCGTIGVVVDNALLKQISDAIDDLIKVSNDLKKTEAAVKSIKAGK